MYHTHFRGTHYEAGFRWGSLLFRHKNIISDRIPFEMTSERMEYAAACVPVYERVYPEILEEIRGLAEGQRLDARILQAVLFGMYAMPPVCSCSCFAAVEEDEILVGRNSDFLTELEGLNMNVIYRLTDGAYSFTGNTTAFVEMEDGVNEHGLAIGLTSVYPLGRKPGLNAGLLLRYFLEKCRTVAEVVSCIGRLPIASAQTFTLADASGEIAVIECDSERTAIGRCPADSGKAGKRFLCGTNAFHLPEMAHHNDSAVDDWFAETRYQTLMTALSKKENAVSLQFAKELLSGRHGFICQYDRNTGKDTVWSVVYDVKRRKIYRSEGNPGRCRYKEDIRFRPAFTYLRQ